MDQKVGKGGGWWGKSLERTGKWGKEGAGGASLRSGAESRVQVFGVDQTMVGGGEN